MALTLLSCRVPSADVPVVGVGLEPYVLVRRGDTNATANAEEVPEEGTGDSRYSLRFRCGQAVQLSGEDLDGHTLQPAVRRWYRSVANKGGACCWIHQDREATLQCILCLRSKVEVRKSYHCSTDCLKKHWSYHRELHNQKRLNGEWRKYMHLLVTHRVFL